VQPARQREQDRKNLPSGDPNFGLTARNRNAKPRARAMTEAPLLARYMDVKQQSA